MSLAQTSTAALRRAAAPADVIDHLQTRIEVLEETVRQLTGADLVDGLLTLYPQLTPTMARILAALVARPMASRDVLVASAYGLKEQPVEEHTVIVHLSKLRRRLPPDIVIHNHRDVGWSLDGDARAHIKAALAAQKEA